MQSPLITQANQEPDILVSPKNVIALQTGEIVQAEVLTVTDTSVAVRMKNTILEARTELSLKQGEVISLLVEEAGQDIRLRLLQADSAEAGSVQNTIFSALNALKNLKPVANDIKTLTLFFANVPKQLKESMPELMVLAKFMTALDVLSESDLKSAVQDSGLFFEARLHDVVTGPGQDGLTTENKVQTVVSHDLKGALLILEESLTKRDVMDRLQQAGFNVRELAGAVGNLIKNTDFYQLQSKLTETLQVFVPFFWQDLKDGEIVFRESEKGPRDEQAFSCTINLDLEGIGKMSARVLLQEGQIYVNILAENEQFVSLLQVKRDVLKTQLDVAGIRLGGLTIHWEPEIDIKQAQAGGLNIRI